MVFIPGSELKVLVSAELGKCCTDVRFGGCDGVRIWGRGGFVLKHLFDERVCGSWLNIRPSSRPCEGPQYVDFTIDGRVCSSCISGIQYSKHVTIVRFRVLAFM